MTNRSIVSPDDQGVTFVELFFDLVFVFSVTQVVQLLHQHFGWAGVGQAVLVFWLIWWAWTQFTWALNAADTTHPAVRIGTLLATGVSFFMAAAVPEAFGGRGAWFAISYVLVRVIGLALYIRVALAANRSQHAAVRVFALMSIGGLASALAGGIAGGQTQYWLWGMTILLDVLAAVIAGEAEGWNLHPEHFAERHGLFVIIALGESLIVAAGGLAGASVTRDLIVAGVLAVATACVLWWSYFASAKPALDRALEAASGARRSMLARDAYSLLHFPMVLGIIGFAVAVEEAVAHPAAPLSTAERFTLALGVVLFTAGMGLALRRATGRLPLPRVLFAAATALAVVVPGGVPPSVSLGFALAGAALLVVVEHRAEAIGVAVSA